MKSIQISYDTLQLMKAFKKLLINKPALLASAQMIILANPMEGSQFS